MLKFLIIPLALCTVIGCGDNSPGKSLTVNETATKAKADLNSRLAKTDLPPEVKAQANAQLDREMQATAARRGKPLPSGQ